ncbi:Hypothetical protein SCF082_LOCUS38674, partial [Durusdinium trenchii]
MEEESGIADADVEDLEDAGEDEQDAGKEYQDGDLEKALEEEAVEEEVLDTEEDVLGEELAPDVLEETLAEFGDDALEQLNEIEGEVLAELVAPDEEVEKTALELDDEEEEIVLEEEVQENIDLLPEEVPEEVLGKRRRKKDARIQQLLTRWGLLQEKTGKRGPGELVHCQVAAMKERGGPGGGSVDLVAAFKHRFKLSAEEEEVIEEAESFEVNEGITEGALAGELGLPVMARSPGCKRRGSASRSFKWFNRLELIDPMAVAAIFGDANLSFALKLAKHREALGHVGRIIATTFETLDCLRERYKEIDETIKTLEGLYTEVYHGVDCTRIAVDSRFQGMEGRLGAVYYNFPHAGVVTGFFDGHPCVNWRHENLMRLFFRALRSFMKPGGLVKVASSKTAVGVRFFYIMEAAAENEFVHIETMPFMEWHLHRYGRSYGDKRDVHRRPEAGENYNVQRKDADMVAKLQGGELPPQSIRMPPKFNVLKACPDGPFRMLIGEARQRHAMAFLGPGADASHASTTGAERVRRTTSAVDTGCTGGKPVNKLEEMARRSSSILVVALLALAFCGFAFVAPSTGAAPEPQLRGKQAEAAMLGAAVAALPQVALAGNSGYALLQLGLAAPEASGEAMQTEIMPRQNEQLQFLAAEVKMQVATLTPPQLVEAASQVAVTKIEMCSARPSDEEEPGNDASPKKRKTEDSIHLRKLQLSGLGPKTTKEELQAWVEEQLPGGCGIESVRRLIDKPGHFLISFRKDQNAKRALKSLHGADMNGHTVSATLRALELSRQSSKEAFAKGRGPVPFTATLFGAADDPTGGDRGQARQTAGGSLRRVGRVGEAFGGIGEVVDLHLPMKEMTWPVWRGGAFDQDVDGAYLSLMLMAHGDFVAETYAAVSGGAAFAEAEDLLGAECFAEAVEKGHEALGALKASGNKTAVADATRLVVKGLVGQEQHARAQELVKEELARFREAGDRLGEAKMLMSMGESTAAKEGKAKAEAVSSLKEARSICRNLNNKEWEAKALLTLALLNLAKVDDLGAVETALKNATEARDICQDFDNKRIEAECLWAMAEARGLVSSPDDALDAADEAMDLFLELR